MIAVPRQKTGLDTIDIKTVNRLFKMDKISKKLCGVSTELRTKSWREDKILTSLIILHNLHSISHLGQGLEQT